MTHATSTMTIRLDHKLKQRLEKLAFATHRSKSFLATEAIDEYVSLQEWQIREIRRGLAEARAGDLVSHQKIVKKWKKK